MTAPLDLAALRGLLEKAADYRNYLKEADRYERQHVMDKIRECEVGILSALPALLDFAAEAERLLGRWLQESRNPDGNLEQDTRALLARLAGNGEAR